jgi:malonate decarboxylase delta subunit
METLSYKYAGGGSVSATSVLTGVVGSGNLEVLVEPVDLAGACEVEIVTAAVGFGPVWKAVVDDFFDRWRPADLRISVNDVGATPAVVSLRLDQAMTEALGDAR